MSLELNLRGLCLVTEEIDSFLEAGWECRVLIADHGKQLGLACSVESSHPNDVAFLDREVKLRTPIRILKLGQFTEAKLSDRGHCEVRETEMVVLGDQTEVGILRLGLPPKEQVQIEENERPSYRD